MNDFFTEIVTYAAGIDILELLGLIFGLLAVYYLIKENILTWPAGIVYVVISFAIFLKAKLYADFALHVVYLVLNIYGWYFWINGKKEDEKELPVTTSSGSSLLVLAVISVIGVMITGYMLSSYTDASLPYWDSVTTIFSFTGMWLTTRKKIESWYVWFVVDVIAAAIYMFKGIYFYSFLYFIYIGMAVSGYLVWKKSMKEQHLSVQI